MRQDESFGVIPLSKIKGHWEVFLIQHNKSGYWGFPKGHAEDSESPQVAAFRELKEETNLQLVRLLQEEPLTEQYSFILDRHRVYKTVTYFIAEVGGEVKLQKGEIHDGIWLPFSDAIARVTHQEGKALLTLVQQTIEHV